jgi:hypothetical protein
LVSGAEVALFSLSQTELMKRRKETLQRKNYIELLEGQKKLLATLLWLIISSILEL